MARASSVFTSCKLETARGTRVVCLYSGRSLVSPQCCRHEDGRCAGVSLLPRVAAGDLSASIQTEAGPAARPERPRPGEAEEAPRGGRV